MAVEEVPDYLAELVRTMDAHLKRSEMDIAVALAEADGPLSVPELAERTGYTERTIRKRVETLAEALHGEPQVSRDDEGSAALHPQLAAAVRRFIEDAE